MNRPDVSRLVVKKSQFKIAASRFASSPKVILVIKKVIRIKNFKNNEQETN